MVCSHRGSTQETLNLLGLQGLLRCCKGVITNLLGAYGLASCHTQATINLIGVNVWSGVAPKQQQNRLESMSGQGLHPSSNKPDWSQCLVRGCTQAATNQIGVNVWSGVAPRHQAAPNLLGVNGLVRGRTQAAPNLLGVNGLARGRTQAAFNKPDRSQKYDMRSWSMNVLNSTMIRTATS